MKNIKLENSISDLVVFFIFYLIILILTGIIKSKIIISFLPYEFISSARISSYVSIFTSSLISILVIGLLILIVFFSNIIFELKILENDLLNSFQKTILVMIVFELIKFLLAYFMLEDEMMKISIDNNFISNIKKSKWYVYDNTIKNIMIIISSFIYVFDLYSKKNVKKTSSLMVVFLILLVGLYISTINNFSKL